MTEEQIHLIKKSWKVFREIDPALIGDAFYSKLFSDNRSLRKMFPTSMEEQYKKLIDMLSNIVTRLDRLEIIEEQIIAMAQRHVQYGVKPAHYKLVGKALIWTLQQGLGKDWTPAVEEAWISCYSKLSDTMIRASELHHS